MPDSDSPHDMDAYLRMLQGEATHDQQRKDLERQDSGKLAREQLQPSPFDKPGVYAARLKTLGWVEVGRFRFVDRDFDGDRHEFRLPTEIAWADFMAPAYRPQRGLLLKADHDLAAQVWGNGAEHRLYAQLRDADKTFAVQDFSIVIGGRHHGLLDVARKAQEAKIGSVKEIVAAMVPIHPGSVKRRQGGELRVSQPYAIGKFAVTQKWYSAVIGYHHSCFQGDPQRPVETVSWHDARAFCQKLNGTSADAGLARGMKFALPTEEQWEYACRAGSAGDFGLLSSGREGTSDEMGWHEGNSHRTTHPVGKKMPNAWGLYDMHGNVYEWCEDRLDVSHLGMTGTYHLLRGGAWIHEANSCIASHRHSWQPDGRERHHGFRIVAVPA